MRYADQTVRNNKRKWVYDERYYHGGGYRWWNPLWQDPPLAHGNFNCYRSIRTFPERRASLLTEDELDYGVRIRGRRQGGTLPNPWDDYWISAWSGRKSWKHNSKRKRQWKFE